MNSVVLATSIVDELVPPLVLTAVVLAFVAVVFFWRFFQVFVLGGR